MSTAPDTPPTDETWVYLGRRSSEGKLRAVWRDPDGKELWYAATVGSGRVIGGYYTVSVIRDAERVRVLTGTFSYADSNVDDTERALLEAEDRQAYAARQAAAAEKRAAADKALDRATQPLLDLLEACKTWEAREALINEVSRTLRRATWGTRG